MGWMARTAALGHLGALARLPRAPADSAAPPLGKPWPFAAGSVAAGSVASQSRHDLLHLPAAVPGAGRPVPQYRHAERMGLDAVR